jgi:hypothetical protein
VGWLGIQVVSLGLGGLAGMCSSSGCFSEESLENDLSPVNDMA